LLAFLFGLSFSEQRRHAAAKVCFPGTLNDLPTPEGDFYTQNNARQRRNNVDMVFGIGFFLATLAFGIATNQFEFRNDIPDPIADIECYRAE
jgi:hypothetical protein